MSHPPAVVSLFPTMMEKRKPIKRRKRAKKIKKIAKTNTRKRKEKYPKTMAI